MTDKIYATYTPTTAPGTFHTAIHFERTSPTGEPQHYVIEARPENLDAMSAFDKSLGVLEEAPRSNNGSSLFGKIAARVVQLEPGEYDPSTPYQPIAEGEDLSEPFARMNLFAKGVNDAGFPYRGADQNSNTFASAALKAGGLPPATGIAHDPTGPAGELSEYFAPGLNEPLGQRPGSGSSYDRPAGGPIPGTSASPSRPTNQPAPGMPSPPNEGLRDFYRSDPAWMLQIRRWTSRRRRRVQLGLSHRDTQEGIVNGRRRPGLHRACGVGSRKASRRAAGR